MLNDQIGTGMSTQLRDNQVFFHDLPFPSVSSFFNRVKLRPSTPPPQEAAHYQGQAGDPPAHTHHHDQGVDRWPAAAAEPLPVAQLASPSIAQNSR